MKKTFLAAALVLAAVAAPPAAAQVTQAVPGGTWTQDTITEPDGTQLHADILRPTGLGPNDKTPVIVSIGPYFNHSGQEGPAGAALDQNPDEWDPAGPSAGPSTRFFDFVTGAKLMQRGYTFVMVDLRGFGGSTGCLDWGGPGEQADVVETIKWAASRSWSTGSVGTYGKSYDGMTGLIAAAKQTPGLKAVVSGEPVYDDYRYLYGDGIRRLNSLLTPALYDEIDATPGPVGDTQNNPTYSVSGANDTSRPGCLAANFADQAANDDHASDFWKARNLIAAVKGSQIPVFLTQGLTENNTAPDGVAEFLANHTGPERAWMGPWNHVRGNELDGTKLAMGRAGWFDEVMRWYDKYLKGIEPTVVDPPFAIQSVTSGKWRPELEWPPADATDYATTLSSGTYTDTAASEGAKGTALHSGDLSKGVWTVSKPLPYDVHLAGAATVKVDVAATAPNANLVVDIYDLDASGTGPLVARQGSLIRSSGPLTLRMMSADWKFAAGHRIGVRVTDDNSEWWVFAAPTQQTVTVNGGSASFPFLQYLRTQRIQGDSGTTRTDWLAQTATAPAAAVTAAKDFNLPPQLAPEPAEMKAQLDAFK